MPLLSVENLKTHFHTRNGVVRAVDGISLSVEKGQTLGIVGESGSGKSVSCYSLLGLIPSPPGRIEAGTALFDGADLLAMNQREIQAIRGRRISMIFQDPMTALNPYMSIGGQLTEPLRVHGKMPKSEAMDRAAEALKSVGILDGARRMKDFPHQYSGGMRQRVMIAMALITKPDLLIADEPTTALDVTVQAQILDLIKKMQEELGMAVILVTHDMGVIAATCDRVLVMYAGRICEAANADELFGAPRHPYAKALMASMPSAHEHGQELYTIPGMPPDLSGAMERCPFAPRCERADERCEEGAPALEVIAGSHSSSCIHAQAGEF